MNYDLPNQGNYHGAISTNVSRCLVNYMTLYVYWQDHYYPYAFNIFKDKKYF